MEIIDKIHRRLVKYQSKISRWLLRERLHPIHVSLFHQVSDSFDETTMIACDWTETKQFKANVLKLKDKYEFITLEEAHRHLKRDRLRLKDYAVMTSDDGWASLKNILPWLEEQEIPVTLFVNPNYADGLSFREKETERYMTRSEMESYKQVSIGLHGLEHINVAKMNETEFRDYVEKSVKQTSNIAGYVPYWAYTWGKYSEMHNRVLREMGITPVYINGEANIKNTEYIERELLDGKTL